MPGQDNSKGSESLLINCYNRGCGKKFDPNKNESDSCVFHPGAPFFHDAYKGWSCCKKKCTDFTEFLNIKGCTKSYHSNEKPPEPVKQEIDKELEEECSKTAEAAVVENKPMPQRMARPALDTPLIGLKIDISPALLKQVESLSYNEALEETSNEIQIGTSCKNGGCKATYQGPDSIMDTCIHHPGYPVFHEGLKFWTCCTKRTTDFNAFLDQVGCTRGEHVWRKEKESNSKLANCRYDWHQTSSTVVLSIFAKKYDPKKSFVEMNPIRLKIHLFFPEDETTFHLDLELRGIVDVSKSKVSMLQTKVEVKMQKAEAGSWSMLNISSSPNHKEDNNDNEEEGKVSTSDAAIDQNDDDDEDDVDLSDL